MEKNRQVEKSIIKKYRPKIWSKFIKAIKNYQLIIENDHIAVCISGGKDSFLLAKCFDELQRQKQINFKVSYIVMNPGYQDSVINNIKKYAKLLNLSINIFAAPIFQYTNQTTNPCFICARMRRGYLYNYAQSIGCNKIALGHHFDDVIETTMLNLLYAGNINTMPAILDSKNYPGMKLIRPLYYVREQDIINWARYNDLHFIDCACNVNKLKEGKRAEIKTLIKELELIYPDIPKNIFTALNKSNQ